MAKGVAPSSGAGKRLFLIDGMPIVYRAFFVFLNNPRLTSTGYNSSSAFGYTTSLLQIIEAEQPTHIAVVFDHPGPNRRTEEYPDYKAQREKAPEGLTDALPAVRKLTDAMGITMLSTAGVEADDVIGTLARRAEGEGYETFIVTLDKDFAQLVTDRTFLYRIGRMASDPPIVYDLPGVRERWGVASAEQVIDLIGLAGDSVDNIPGVPGVGEKTAQKLIAQFGSVEELVANTDSLKGKQKENIESYAQQAILSKRLATIDLDVEIDVDFDSLAFAGLDPDRVIPVFRELEFNSVITRLWGGSATAAGAPEGADLDAGDGDGGALRELDRGAVDYRLVGPEDQAEVVAQLAGAARLGWWAQDSGTTAHSAELIGLAVSDEAGRGWYLPADGDPWRLTAAVAPLLEAAPTVHCGYDLKRTLTLLRWHGLLPWPADRVPRGFDARAAHQLVDSDGRHDLGALAERYLGYRLTSAETERADSGDGTLPLEPEVLPCERADVALQLCAGLERQLEGIEAADVWRDIEMPLMPLLVEMEMAGVAVNVHTLTSYAGQLEKEIASHEADLHRLAGREFNLNSPKQLGEVLFDELKISAKPKKTRTGQYMTNEQELTRHLGAHPIVEKILEYRVVQKLKSTYVDALPGAVHPATGRIHTTFNPLVAATGRLNSENPNLQNIPIRTERGREIRRAFVAGGDDLRLITADYSQIELRIIASVTGDEGLIEDFAAEVDIHAATAAKVFDVPVAEVTEGQRSRAKMVNFGLAYGMSSFGLSQRLNIPRAEAKEIIERYFAKYPSIEQYMTDTVDFARANGYVKTLRGRRRYLRDINSRNHTARAAAERIAINAPIQGSAADMIKLAMLDIAVLLRERQLESRMILQVHDELVFEAPTAEVDEVVALAESAMRQAMPLRVPVVVETAVGADWLEAH